LFGLGYVVARDRPFQLDVLRRAALGQLSERIGPDGLPNDRLMRLIGMPAIARAAAQAATADERAALAAFAAGVNARWSQSALPLEFRALRYRPAPWVISDSIAIGKLMGWTLGANPYADLTAEQLRSTLGDEWADALFAGAAALTPPVVREQTATRATATARHEPHPAVNAGGGSNAWAVAGSRSATGQPLLANDPHLTYTNPSIWYEAALEAPDFNVAGVTIPGTPLIGIGRTPTFAWGFTVSMVHQTLLYRERLNAAGDAVADGEDWTPLTTCVETIPVKGSQPEQLVVRSTPRGPLLSDLEPTWSADPFSLHWVGVEPSHEIAAFLRINAARGVDDAVAAREQLALPPFAMAAADAAGDIATIAYGRYPSGADRPGLLDATHFPPRYVPTDQMPMERNPARGWIASANGRLTAPDYPYPLKGSWEPRFRIQRIAEQLEARSKHSPADMRAMQLDRYSSHAASVLPLVMDLLHDVEPAWAVAELRGWDCMTCPGSRAALLFYAFFHQWVTLAMTLRLTPELASRWWAYASGETQFTFYDRLLAGELDAWFGGEQSRQLLARKAFQDGLTWIEQQLGSDRARWTWGAAHTLTMQHPFGMRPGPHARRINVGPFPLGGDRSTLWLTWWKVERPFDVLGGPSLRFVADLRDARRGWLTNTLGQTGQPFSRHYRDQTADFLSGRMHAFPRTGTRRRTRIESVAPPEGSVDSSDD
jgi:penicillin amidase